MLQIFFDKLTDSYFFSIFWSQHFFRALIFFTFCTISDPYHTIHSYNIPAMLRIRDVYPGSRIRLFPSQIRLFSIPDPGSEFFHPGSASKNLRILTQKWFLSTRRIDHPGSGSLLFTHPGAKKAPDAGSGSATLHTWAPRMWVFDGRVSWRPVRCCTASPPSSSSSLWGARRGSLVISSLHQSWFSATLVWIRIRFRKSVQPDFQDPKKWRLFQNFFYFLLLACCRYIYCTSTSDSKLI